MNQQATGGALVLIGAAPIGFVALDVIGGYNAGVDPVLLAYGVLIIFFGGGVYAGEIQFEQASASKYEGLVFLYAIVIVLMIVGSFLITLS